MEVTHDHEEWSNMLIDIYNHSENDIKLAIDDIACELDISAIEAVSLLLNFIVETHKDDMLSRKEEIIRFCKEREKANETASKLLASLDIDIDI